MRVCLLFILLWLVHAPRAAFAAPLYLGKNVYEFFGVNPRDPNPEAAFKASYRAMVMRYHPDRNGGSARAEAATKLLNEFMAEVKKNGYYAHLAPKPAAPAPPKASPPPPPPEPPASPKPTPAPEPPKFDPAARAAAEAYSRTAREGAHVSGGTGGNRYPYAGQYERSADPCARLYAIL